LRLRRSKRWVGYAPFLADTSKSNPQRGQVRLVKKMGNVQAATLKAALQTMREMFEI